MQNETKVTVPVPPCNRCGYDKWPYPKSKISHIPKNYCRCGTPIGYHPRLCDQIIEYFSKEPVEEIQELDYIDKEGIEHYRTVRRPAKFVTIDSFARKVGVSHKTLNEWANKFPEFRSAFDQAKALYKEHLIVNGMLGLYNSHFTTFVAVNTTDMRDKKEVDNNNNLNVNISLTSLFNATNDQRPDAIEAELTDERPAIEGGRNDLEEDAEITDLRGSNVMGFTPATVED